MMRWAMNNVCDTEKFRDYKEIYIECMIEKNIPRVESYQMILSHQKRMNIQMNLTTGKSIYA